MDQGKRASKLRRPNQDIHRGGCCFDGRRNRIKAGTTSALTGIEGNCLPADPAFLDEDTVEQERTRASGTGHRPWRVGVHRDGTAGERGDGSGLSAHWFHVRAATAHCFMERLIAAFHLPTWYACARNSARLGTGRATDDQGEGRCGLTGRIRLQSSFARRVSCLNSGAPCPSTTTGSRVPSSG